MASKIADVEIQLRAQVATLERDLGQAKRKLESFANDTRRGFLNLGSGIERAFASVRAAPIVAGVTALGAALGIATKRAIDFASEIVDTAGNLGITTDALQELRFAASQAGVGVETLDNALKFLNRNQSEAISGNERIADAFRRLGVSVTDAAGELKSTDRLFTEVIGRIGELSSPAERTAISMQLLGSSGSELGKLAREGADGIADLRDRARELGLVIDEETLVAAEKAGDKFDALFQVLRTRGVQTLLNLTPLFDSLSDSMLRASESAGKFFVEFGKSEDLRRAEENVSSLQAALNDLRESNVFGLNDSAIADLEARLDRAKAELIQLRFAASTELPGITPADDGSGGSSDRLGAPRDRSAERRAARDAARDLAQLRTESARAIEEAAKREEESLAKIISLTERRLEAEIDLADARGDDELAQKKRIELIEERYARERAEIERTVIEAESAAKAIEDLGVVRDAQLEEVARGANKEFEELKELGIRGLSDALADLALTGELTFKSLGESFIREFIQVAIEKGVTKLVDALASVSGSFDSGGGGAASFLSLFTPFASGGVVTRPTLGLVGESGPEAVIPLDRLAGSGSGLTVNVINNVSDQVGVEVRQNRSTKRTEIVIDRRIAQGVRSAQGEEALQTYGVQRQGRRRA